MAYLCDASLLPAILRGAGKGKRIQRAWGWTQLALLQAGTAQQDLEKSSMFYSPGLSRCLVPWGDRNKGPRLPNIPVFDKTPLPCIVHEPRFCTREEDIPSREHPPHVTGAREVLDAFHLTCSVQTPPKEGMLNTDALKTMNESMNE